MDDVVEEILNRVATTRCVEVRSTVTFANEVGVEPVIGQERRVRRDTQFHVYHLEKRLVHEVETESGGVEMRALDQEWTSLAEFDSLVAALICVNPTGGQPFSIYCDGSWLATFEDTRTTLTVVNSIV